MTRESSKHSPRVDDELAKEGWARSTGGRSDGPRGGEPDNSEPIITLSTSDEVHAGAPPAGMTPADREGRSDLGRLLPRSIFPADRDTLLEAARQAYAPSDLIAELERLEAGRDFATVAEIWESLGHGTDRRF